MFCYIMNYSSSDIPKGKQSIIRETVAKKGLIKLISNYTTTLSFYYDPSCDCIIQVETTGTDPVIFYRPEQSVYNHIAKLNNIKIK